MNFRRNWWIIAVVFIVVGAILFGIAWQLGARGGSIFVDDKGVHTSVNNNTEVKILIDEKSLGEFTSVEVRTIPESVVFIPSDHYGLEVKTAEKLNPTWSLSGGKLTVKVNPNPPQVNLGLNLVLEEFYVHVYFPKDAVFDNIEVDTTSGSIDLSELTAASLTLGSISGRVTADIVMDGGDVYIDTTSGRIDFIGSGSVNRAEMNSISGSINADINDCGEMRLNSTSGSVTAKNSGQTATRLTIDSISGSIKASGNIWESSRVSSTSGAVEVSGKLEGRTVVDSISGSVKLSVNGALADYDKCHLESLSGTCRVNGQKYGREVTMTGSNNTGDTIEVSTTSGSITVDFSE